MASDPGGVGAVVEAADRNKSPGHFSWSWPLLDALNTMFAERIMPASFLQRVVRLIAKVAGIPASTQLRSITLLGTDYKLLTKILVAHLIHVLFSVLLSTQLCSDQGWSIFDGPASILLLSSPGFLFSIDFFHAYDHVSIPWVDKDMETRNFGVIFWGWVTSLHRDVSAASHHLPLHCHLILHQAGKWWDLRPTSLASRWPTQTGHNWLHGWCRSFR